LPDVLMQVVLVFRPAFTAFFDETPPQAGIVSVRVLMLFFLQLSCRTFLIYEALRGTAS
jgi:hypothetical protein